MRPANARGCRARLDKGVVGAAELGAAEGESSLSAAPRSTLRQPRPPRSFPPLAPCLKNSKRQFLLGNLCHQQSRFGSHIRVEERDIPIGRSQHQRHSCPRSKPMCWPFDNLNIQSVIAQWALEVNMRGVESACDRRIGESRIEGTSASSPADERRFRRIQKRAQRCTHNGVYERGACDASSSGREGAWSTSFLAGLSGDHCTALPDRVSGVPRANDRRMPGRSSPSCGPARPACSAGHGVSIGRPMSCRSSGRRGRGAARYWATVVEDLAVPTPAIRDATPAASDFASARTGREACERAEAPSAEVVVFCDTSVPDPLRLSDRRRRRARSSRSVLVPAACHGRVVRRRAAPGGKRFRVRSATRAGRCGVRPVVARDGRPTRPVRTRKPAPHFTPALWVRRLSAWPLYARKAQLEGCVLPGASAMLPDLVYIAAGLALFGLASLPVLAADRL